MKQIVLVVISLFLVVSMPSIGTSGNVNISIGVPPPLTFVGQPDVVVVPSAGSDVYLVPNTEGLYFYSGYWYRFYSDHWFRSTIYSGAWHPVGVSLVPAPVVVIPPDYILGVPPEYHRIHYGDFHRHWRDWGHNRHWNNQAWFRDHSRHHWGGRDFHGGPGGHHAGGGYHGGGGHRPPTNHAGGDHHGEVAHKPPVNHGGNAHKSSVSYNQTAHQGGQQHQGDQRHQ